MKREVIYAQLNNPRRIGSTEVTIGTAKHRNSGRMRKYYQVALIIVALVSMVTLLFYRHEYNKLRYVLEVLNFFGKAGEKSPDANCTREGPIVRKQDLGFDVPMPSWQRLDDDLYAYSAHSVNKREIRTVAFGTARNDPNLGCNVFFEGKNEATQGQFSYSVLGDPPEGTDVREKPEYRGYHLICEYIDYEVPVGVSFFPKGQRNRNEAPIFSVKDSPHNLHGNASALCVAPPLVKPISRADMISFLNFHELVGMDNFIVYDYGVPSAFTQSLKEMAGNPSPYWKFTYTSIPWNFPFTGIEANVVKDIVEADCLYRTYNKAMLVATVSWEEYIVLKYHHMVPALLMDFDSTKSSGGRYKLETSVFCTQQKDDKRATNTTPIVLRKTHTDRNVIENRPLYIYKPHDSLNVEEINTQEAGTNLVAINRYQHCDGTADDHNADTYDPSILRFAGDMKNAPIFRKFVTEKMFPRTNYLQDTLK